jgi:amidohydrolase
MSTIAFSQNSLQQDITEIEDKLIKWRHYFHENPELSNREFKTAEKIAEH